MTCVVPEQRKVVPRMGFDPMISTLKGPSPPCCSMLSDTEIEHPVRCPAASLYLRCCPVLPPAGKFVSKYR